jgi:NADPH-dependent glutamate synthase beta subunit-like oxidoreductase
MPELPESRHAAPRVGDDGTAKCRRPAHRDAVAPCNAACPLGADLEGALDLMRQGRLDEARDLLLRENPMPGVTGRVCDHPCQTACHRAAFDEAVNLHAIERVLGDLEPAAPPTAPVRRHAEQVAVVGSGPAGLACAYHLARLGYGVEVFEAEREPGGALRHGIPEYHLPREVLEREIERVRAQGVTLHCGVRVGTAVPWTRLDGFDAVFLATGARIARRLELTGEEDADVRPGRELLRGADALARGSLGSQVVVVGGTDTAVDCARTALRLGAEPVILCQGTRADLTASAEAVEEAIREGVRFEFRTWPVGVRTAGHAENEGALEAIRTLYAEGSAARPRRRLTAVECVRMQPGAEACRPVPVPGSGFLLPADLLLTALGEEPDLDFLPAGVGRLDYVVRVDDCGSTHRAGFFAGGDLTGGPRTVAHSLASGKRAAIGIARYLRGRAGETLPDLDLDRLRPGGRGGVSITRWRGDDPVRRRHPLDEVVPLERLNLAHFATTPGKPDRHRSFAERSSSFAEANLGLTLPEALAEARRCFACGVCNRCDLCLVVCPNSAIGRDPEGDVYVVSPERCRGCGICVAECPRGAVRLEDCPPAEP